MIRSMKVKGFKGIPYLESSPVMMSHPEGLFFSLDKPTVIVGPNGSGKSAVLKTLALRFMADLLGYSAFDGDYVDSRSPYWTCTAEWREDWVFLSGLQCETDNAPALFYRPRHVPGNEPDVTHAMCMGLHEQAKAYGEMVKEKSSGEGNRNRLAALCSILRQGGPAEYHYARWKFGQEPRDLKTRDVRYWRGPQELKAEALKKLFANHGNAVLVLMDEPEDSLDALSELKFWKTVTEERLAQMVIATHSLYPIVHPEKFSVIEAVPGYAKEVRNLI